MSDETLIQVMAFGHCRYCGANVHVSNRRLPAACPYCNRMEWDDVGCVLPRATQPAGAVLLFAVADAIEGHARRTFTSGASADMVAEDAAHLRDLADALAALTPDVVAALTAQTDASHATSCPAVRRGECVCLARYVRAGLAALTRLSGEGAA